MYTPANLSEAQERIRKGQASCVIMRDGHIVDEAIGIGVKPILQFLESSSLKDAEVADKIVGKAAAMLLTLGGVKYVYGELMSVSGKEFLEKRGIAASYGKLIDRINNRDNTGMCPLEESVIDTDEPSKGYEAIKKTVARLMAAK